MLYVERKAHRPQMQRIQKDVSQVRAVLTPVHYIRTYGMYRILLGFFWFVRISMLSLHMEVLRKHPTVCAWQLSSNIRSPRRSRMTHPA